MQIGLLPVTIAAGGAILLTSLFSGKKVLYRFYRKKGNNLFLKGDYSGAVQNLIHAEKCWGLNAIWQTRKSYIQDLTELRSIVKDLGECLEKLKVRMETARYEESIDGLREFFASGSRDGMKYAKAFEAFTEERRQFRQGAYSAAKILVVRS